MSFNSIIDNYYELIHKDSDYYNKWLTLYGTECRLLTPKKEIVKRINDIYEAFGDHTYASNNMNYDVQTVYLMIQPEDFARIENGIETAIRIVSPVKLDDSNLIELRKLNYWFTFEVRAPIEEYWGMLYRASMYLNRVREVDK